MSRRIAESWATESWQVNKLKAQDFEVNGIVGDLIPVNLAVLFRLCQTIVRIVTRAQKTWVPYFVITIRNQKN
jgi:hypothetical protein